MNQISSYEELVVWQKSIALVKKVYALLRSFPEEERFGLTSQIRRSAISVPSNIAEDFGRGSSKNFLQFLYVSRGSLYELETQLYIAKDLNFISDNQETENLISEIGKMLNSMIQKLKLKNSNH
ncbi:S23 ribosomal (modular protein) [Capnocytophaga canimorsus]|uniref:S23 ribosomal (Modular protein) n=1 Tax=Capnocytophaga canimorsus TaxID=28188 RepID=A0A0B7IRZ1_9FLAO|nr:four helix bundle protein [Capnocytophaga canimorsus]CEN52698.1 S23 ribosomal (modular protein) [Capnocytophaga canimorsus]